MVRLVTKEDILNHPEFAGKGISVNQYYDFNDDEEIIYIPNVNQTQSVHIETVPIIAISQAEIVKKLLMDAAPTKKAKVPAPKKYTTKNKK